MKRIVTSILFLTFLLAGCQPKTVPVKDTTSPLIDPTRAATRAPASGLDATATAVSAPASPTATMEAHPLYRDSSQPTDLRIADLLSRMTLEEKIGQMTQVEKDSLMPEDVTRAYIGSVLSGGGGSPVGYKTASAWADMTVNLQDAALLTRLGIPLLYGEDAVHGNGNLYGATIFPHNIGLGAANDPELVEEIGKATAVEMAATGVRWNFAPVVAVVQDIRWGRTYEGFSESTDLVTKLGAAYVKGLQDGGVKGLAGPQAVLATPKHYIGDGGTAFGSSTTEEYLLDQGDLQVDEAALREKFLPPYEAAVKAGALSIMVSFSSWNGLKMHAQQYLLTDVLKGELGFQGFLVSDWQAIDQVSSDYYTAVVTSINAGLDMIMVPYDYNKFMINLERAVKRGDVSQERIDDAVTRILRAKFALGLFENPFPDPVLQEQVGTAEHRALARQAVRESVVLLINQDQALPLKKDAGLIFVAGQGADDIGLQCGGWTIEWQGRSGPITPGTTILDGIRQAVNKQTRVEYEEFGKFEKFLDAQGQPLVADTGIVVVSEVPYAEGVGDRTSLDLPVSDQVTIDRVLAQSKRVVLVVLSGRPIVITEALLKVDAVIAAWLPGTEGNGVTDVLFGDYNPTGRLPYTWPRWSSQLPFDFKNLPTSGCESPLFPFGYGLSFEDESPQIPDCVP